MTISQSVLKAIKEAKSLEEVKKIAKDNNIEISDIILEKLFNNYHNNGELADDQLQNVSGGCDTETTKTNCCSRWQWWQAPHYGLGEYKRDPHSYYEPTCCGNCWHSYYVDGPCGDALYYCVLD